MKKTIVFLGLLLVVLGLFVNSKIDYSANNTLSDNEIIEMYLTEERGEGNYDVFIQDNTDDEYIRYTVYDSGKFCTMGEVKRSYCNYLLGIDQ